MGIGEGMGIGEVRIASDGTRIYTYEQAKMVFRKLECREFLLDDLMLMILGAGPQPVIGATLLMNELFLLYKEVLKDRSEDPRFVPYKPGPHSFHMAGKLDPLDYHGVLKCRGRRNSNSESFTLTPKGRAMAEEVLRRLSKEDRALVEEKRKGWDQLGVSGILDYVHKHYPEYREASSVKDKYKDVVWGRD